MRRLISILFWSVLSAAFIGPGTVIAATKAGHGFGPALLWALLFSTIACIVLQEASARVAIASGDDLGRAIRRRFARTAARIPVLFLVVTAIVVGCAAYEMGNIVGGVAGAQMVVDADPRAATIAMAVLSASLLHFGTTRQVVRALGALVAVMGVLFLIAAMLLRPDLGPIVRGLVTPSIPAGSGLLVAGLVGTTVVPYNLFLGSGIAVGRDLKETRIGLSVAIGLGGLISMAVVVVGTAVVGEYSLPAVAAALEARVGRGASTLFGLGLFAAGLSSAITAPLAAAITARSLFARDENVRDERSWLYRGTWVVVLVTGVFFGLIGVKPVQAIVVAQAANGILLPLVAVFLLFVMNDREIVGPARNGTIANALLVVVVGVAFFLGARNVLAAIRSVVALFTA